MFLEHCVLQEDPKMLPPQGDLRGKGPYRAVSLPQIDAHNPGLKASPWEQGVQLEVTAELLTAPVKSQRRARNSNTESSSVSSVVVSETSYEYVLCLRVNVHACVQSMCACVNAYVRCTYFLQNV